ncbi:hypothetical protein FUA23_21110 [Neolewinella aurantiaca]|uniref:Peptidoglycan binding protein n=1 Tax=Neolewinella aurantiaca TaxID=2602767 RepID=A0A5C7F316_9BACT|nr:hypothetical protein [Neolewinella aurantiaca]TXF84713.1 hypothetical protein FUA23_21110 [Neolewinella aurantiaca]
MVSTDFIAACQRLKDLDLSAGNAVVLDVAVTEVMPPSYEMPYRATLGETFARSGPAPARNRRGQWHELVQHLHDLRYITEAYFVAWHERRAADKAPLPPQLAHIYAGIRVYLAEEDYPLYSELAPFPDTTFTERTEWVEKHLSILVFRLSQFTSFDDEMEPPAGYRVGEQTVYGRSLLFRVRVLFAFGQQDFADKIYFDTSLLGYLVALNNGLGDPVREFMPTAATAELPFTLWRYLLSWDQLFAAFRKQNRFVANDAGNRMPYILVYDIEEQVGGAAVELSRQEERRRDRLQRKLEKRLRNARLHQETGGNQLGLRLLQLGLWRAGFYVGAIDGAFGPVSHAALRDLLAQEWDADRPVVSQRQLGLALQSGDENEGRVWVADLRAVGNILEAYAPASGAEADWEENAVWESINTKAVDPDWEEEILKRRDAVAQLYPDQRVNPLRRIYYGLRGLLRSAFRAIGKILKWVIDRVGAVAGAIFSFLKATVKRIQEGIGLFFEGFRYFTHYLLGKPFITTGPEREDGTATIMATRLVLDFDTTNFVSSGVTDEDITNHRNTLRRLREGLDFFLETVGKIFNLIGSLTTPMGWIRLGVLIAREVRRVLRGERMLA